MRIVNRCAITVTPRQPFIDWAQQLRPDQPLPPAAFEPGLYLLPTYGDSDQAQEPLAHIEVDESFLEDLHSVIKASPLT